MDEQAPAEQRLAALHTALLAFYDQHTSVIHGQRPELTRRERLMSQGLQRLRLQWLPVVVALAVSAVRSMRRGTPEFGTCGRSREPVEDSPARIPTWHRPRSGA